MFFIYTYFEEHHYFSIKIVISVSQRGCQRKDLQMMCVSHVSRAGKHVCMSRKRARYIHRYMCVTNP